MLFDTKQYLPPLTIKPRQSSRRSPAPCQKALISPARTVERTDGRTVPADWGHDADERVGLGAVFWVQLWTALRREGSHWMDAGELVSCPTLCVSHFVNSCCDSDSSWALTETSVSHGNAPFRLPWTYPSFLQQVSIGGSLGGVCGLFRHTSRWPDGLIGTCVYFQWLYWEQWAGGSPDDPSNLVNLVSTKVLLVPNSEAGFTPKEQKWHCHIWCDRNLVLR